MAGGAGMGRVGRLLLAGIIVFGLALLLVRLFRAGLPAGEEPRLLYLAALLTLLLASLMGRVAAAPRSSLRWALGQLAVWLGIGFILVLGYTYRSEMQAIGSRLAGELLPAQGQPGMVAEVEPVGSLAGKNQAATSDPTRYTMRFALASDGQFHVDALIGYATVRFVLDTGASDVILSPDDARRIGIDPAALNYTRIYQTASGSALAAPVNLPTVEIGPIRLHDVKASVMQREGGPSLLGMSLLKRLTSFQVDGPTLTLVQ